MWGSIPLIIFVSLLWNCSSRSMSFQCLGPHSWRQHTRWSLPRAEGHNHLLQPVGPASFDAAWDTMGFLGSKHVANSHPAFYPAAPPSSQQGSIPSSPSLYWYCTNPGAGPCTWLCWTSWDSHGLISWAAPSGWQPVPQVCQLRCSVWCWQKRKTVKQMPKCFIWAHSVKCSLSASLCMLLNISVTVHWCFPHFLTVSEKRLFSIRQRSEILTRN